MTRATDSKPVRDLVAEFKAEVVEEVTEDDLAEVLMSYVLRGVPLASLTSLLCFNCLRVYKTNCVAQLHLFFSVIALKNGF